MTLVQSKITHQNQEQEGWVRPLAIIADQEDQKHKSPSRSTTGRNSTTSPSPSTSTSTTRTSNSPRKPTNTTNRTANSMQIPTRIHSPKHDSLRNHSTRTPASPKKDHSTSTPNLRRSQPSIDDGTNPYANVTSSKWKLSELKFMGSFSYDTIGEQENITGESITDAIQLFQDNPQDYVALMFQADAKDWKASDQSYTLIRRENTVRFQPQGVSPDGWMTIYVYEYQHLPRFPKNQLPASARDRYTMDMVHHRRKLHSTQNPPILPGRGMGVGDTPLLKLIGDIDPSDIHQGQVGDCWLLSAISALAEFDGAVKKLFRKTRNLDQLPGPKPNTYTVTLWDLPTWKEVDIVIDEGLAAAPDGKLLASRPSEDGELWVCYLEKALAVHCGGWDKITGGQCSHAWALMTGCKHQYTIRKNPKTGLYGCYAKYDPSEGKWAPHKNCPQENNSDMWRVAWPEVGGGGAISKELTKEELFMKMFAWDNENFIVAAGTNGTSDKELTDGMVDNHAYSVIECVDNAAGTEIDLFKVRNPWGKGEIEDGEFDDDGPGWDRYPQIKKLLNPVLADDGIFWLTKAEFFQYFDHIYVSASNMTEFLED